MKETRKVQIGTGIVALVLLGFLLMLLVAALKTSGVLKRESVYYLSAIIDDIGELKPQAPVKLGGVRIGRVQSIVLDPGLLKPRVEISISKAFYVHESSCLAVRTSGILGETYLAILPGVAVSEDEKWDVLQDGDLFENTQPAIIFENLVDRTLAQLLTPPPQSLDAKK